MPSHDTLKREVDVVLIWGTFAKNANWVQKGSNAREKLRSELKENGIRCRFHVFEWSSDNSHVERKSASRALEKFILNVKIKSGNDIYVVAHSHGGSLVKMSLNNSSVDEAVSGVFTLGTPFFHVNRRRTEFLLRVLPFLFAIYLFLFSTSVAADMLTAAGMSPILFFFGLAVSVVVGYTISAMLRRYLSALEKENATTFPSATQVNTKFVCYCRRVQPVSATLYSYSKKGVKHEKKIADTLFCSRMYDDVGPLSEGRLSNHNSWSFW